MLLFQATVNNQTEGLRIDDALQTKIWGQIGDADLVKRANDKIEDQLALLVAFGDGLSLADAITYVGQHVQRVE